MKLIISLILIISILLNNVQSFKLHNDKNVIKKVGEQVCFTDSSPSFNGFSSNFVLFGYNANTQTAQGIQPMSFFEQGYIDIDYQNSRVYLNFEVEVNQITSLSQIWSFASNNTEYLLQNINGEDVCVNVGVSIPIPVVTLKYLIDFELGTVDVEVFQVEQKANYTDLEILVNKDDCSIISSNSNNIGRPAGHTMMNFYNYQTTNNDVFQLPSICYNPTSEQLAHKYRHLVQLPKSLPYHLI